MKSAALRFWLLAGLFAAWIGFLIYLALSTHDQVVLSRPQFLASTLDILAEIDDPASLKVKVVTVYWPEDQKAKLPRQELTVRNLAECVRQKETGSDKDKDLRRDNEIWTGPGKYIVPLVSDGR